MSFCFEAVESGQVPVEDLGLSGLLEPHLSAESIELLLNSTIF
jgi:hypothetical protein